MFRQALESVDSGVMIGRAESAEFEYVNAYAARLRGVLGEELSLRRLLGERDRLGGPRLGEVVGDSQAVRHVLQTQGYAVGLSIHHMRDSGLVMVLLKDITQEHFFRDASVRRGDMRNTLRIFSQLRHEIGNPLNSIKMTLQVLRQNLDEFPRAKVEAYIGRTVGEVARLEKLLASLREFSRTEQLMVREVDLKQELLSFRRLAEAEANQAGLKISVDVFDGARFARANREALGQVLFNLVRNAQQARRSDGGEGHIILRTRRAPGAASVRLEVEDDGVGIPTADIGQVFKPMFTTKSDGTGLGLSLVDRLVSSMGGRISVVSERWRFTRFVIELHAAEEDPS